MKSRIFIAFLVLALALSLVTRVVFAQSATPDVQLQTNAASNSAAQETTNPATASVQEQMKTLTDTYHGQLSEYRDAERAYQVSSGQYVQLQTLVSLEDVVQATHKAQTLRDQVLLTYLTMLKLSLNQGTGIDLAQKSHAQADLDGAITALQSHAVSSGQAVTRDDVNKVAADFTPIEATVKTAAFEAQTLVAIGKLQTVYDKANTLTDEIDTTLVQQNTDVKQPQRQRAITEIRKTLTEAKTTINQVIEHRVNGTNITFSQSTYENSLTDLNQIYAQLSQTLSYLDEILRI